jgi:ssDNA-binding Zn-finger/Zn-ribbon topoisomerase 1
MKDIRPCPYCKEYMYIRRERWICSDYANCGYTIDLENGRAIGGEAETGEPPSNGLIARPNQKQLNVGV